MPASPIVAGWWRPNQTARRESVFLTANISQTSRQVRMHPTHPPLSKTERADGGRFSISEFYFSEANIIAVHTGNYYLGSAYLFRIPRHKLVPPVQAF